MSLYKRKDSAIWWYKILYHGRLFQRSSGVTNKTKARTIEGAFRTSLANADVGIIAPTKETRTVSQLLDLVEANYQTAGKLSSQNRSLLAKTRKAFGSKYSTELTDQDVLVYVRRQQKIGRRPATINRVLELLHKSYTIGKVTPPAMPGLSEKGNVRKGFFSAVEMDLVLGNLPADGLRDFVHFAHVTGMRKGEIESLRWDNLEKDGVLKLAAENAKIGEARTVPCDQGELAEIIGRRKAARSFKDSVGNIMLSRLLFHRGDALPIGDFKDVWKTACIAAGVGKFVCPRCESEGPKKRCPGCKRERKYVGRIFHDCRRSAIRDLVRAGVGQAVAMTISGHRTVSVFQRYNITDEEDKRTALTAQAKYREEQGKNVVSVKS